MTKSKEIIKKTMYKYPKRETNCTKDPNKKYLQSDKRRRGKTEWFQPISSFEDLSCWITISFQKNVICDTFLEWICDFGLGRGFRVRS